MSAKPSVYATLIDVPFVRFDPEVFVEIGLNRSVDWEATDASGEPICMRLDFVLTLDHVKIAGEPLGIRCVFDRLAKDHGIHDGLYVYVLVLRPLVQGQDSYKAALEQAVSDPAVPGRSWCADIGQIRMSWRHAPENVQCLPNGAYEPPTITLAPSPALHQPVRSPAPRPTAQEAIRPIGGWVEIAQVRTA